MAENMNNEEYIDIDTIVIPLEDDTEIECAILDEIEYKGKKYMILCEIDEKDICGDETIIYRYEEDGDDLILDYIEDEAELQEVSEYYENMLAEEDDDEE